MTATTDAAIDADSHIFPRDALKTLEGHGFKLIVDRFGRERIVTPRGTEREYGQMYYDLDVRRAAMRDAGFGRQVLICDQGFAPDYVDLETSKAIFRAYNESISSIQKQHEEFIGVADVPHQDVGTAIKEAERAVNDLGLKAIRIYGTWAGKNIETREWWPFFEKVQDLKVPLMLHSHSNAGVGDLQPNLLARDILQEIENVTYPSGEKKLTWGAGGSGLGFTWEAMAVITGLVLHGVLKQYPYIKVGVLEAGVGWVPFIGARLDLIMDCAKVYRGSDPHEYASPPISSPPSEYVKRHFWFALDNVNEVEVPILVRKFGLGRRFLAQTDFPHPEGSLDVLRWVNKMDISTSDKERITGKNAEELLGIG